MLSATLFSVLQRGLDAADIGLTLTYSMQVEDILYHLFECRFYIFYKINLNMVEMVSP